jgi:hypothetical protein
MNTSQITLSRQGLPSPHLPPGCVCLASPRRKQRHTPSTSSDSWPRRPTTRQNGIFWVHRLLSTVPACAIHPERNAIEMTCGMHQRNALPACAWQTRYIGSMPASSQESGHNLLRWAKLSKHLTPHHDDVPGITFKQRHDACCQQLGFVVFSNFKVRVGAAMVVLAQCKLTEKSAAACKDGWRMQTSLCVGLNKMDRRSTQPS